MNYGIITDMRIRKFPGSLPAEEIQLITEASDALAHPLRVEIFRYIFTQNLARVPVCNKDLVAQFGYSQSTISQHMRKLLVSGLVTARNRETYAYYFVNLGVLGNYIDDLKKLNAPL